MIATWFTARGFDLPRMRFAFRTALACVVALFVAWALGLEHPQWAGMSVWAASQPTRGQLIEKSFFRFAGTVSGTIVGVLLVLGLEIHPAILVIGLALWIAACTWIGNLQRGFVAYGTVLAGYSASMVALLDTAHPDHVFALGADRLATVLTGVIVATLAGYAFAQRMDGAGLRRRLRQLVADCLSAPQDGRALLSRLAAIEEELDPHGAGSLRSRRELRASRAVLLAVVPLILRAEESGVAVRDPAASRALQAAGAALARDDLATAREALAGAHPQDATLARVCAELAAALGAWAEDGGAAPAAPARPLGWNRPLTVLHRDWIGAREAGLRAGGAMALFGAIWQLTGWSAGAYMLLGLSVMISLFSTFENPVGMMRHVFTGQLMGVIGALACRWLVWPFAASPLEQIGMLVPFILLGPLLIGHRRTVIAAFDYNMILLLMSPPHLPLTGSFAGSLASGLAVLAGPVAAWVGYRLVYPISLQRRQGHLVAMMRQDLADIARSPEALAHRAVWQARLYHRALRLVRSSERLARAEARGAEAALSALTLAHAAMRAQELQADPATPAPVRRAAELVLARLAQLRAAPPEPAARAFDRLVARLGGDDARLMASARAALAQLPG